MNPQAIAPFRRARSLAGRLAPVMSGVVLLALLPFVGRLAPASVETGAYFADVKHRVNALPMLLGTWAGTDTDVAPQATELLKPNVILQRQYEDLASNDWFNLLIVHCGEVGDMLGHYPPRCYPNHGWVIDQTNTDTLKLGSDSIPATTYELSWSNDRSRMPLRISNFFIVPSSAGSFAPDMEALRSATRTRLSASLGAAQVQIITPGTMPEERVREITRLVMPAIEDAVRTIADGPESLKEIQKTKAGGGQP